MVVTILQIKLRASWVHTLKEKRAVLQHILQKTKNRFNASVIEADMQDMHQTIGLGIVFASGNNSLADKMAQNILTFMEQNTDAEILEISQERV